jgi:hypothetical protein
MPPSTTSKTRSRLARARGLTALAGLLAALLACAQGDAAGPVGTAQAVAQTAQAAGGSAIANLPPTATALAATAQAAAATLSAKATDTAPTLQAAITQAGDFVETAQAAATVVGDDEAQAVIQQYAQEVLGITVTIVRAGGLTADIERQVQLPEDGEDAQASTASVALKSYGAVLDGGAASVSYGSGVVAGDISVDINASSVGAFSFEMATPDDRSDALALALETFPALADHTFTTFPVTRGFAWVALGNVPGMDARTGQATLVAEEVLLAVTPLALGRGIVSVIVGKGDFAADIVP